MSGNNLPSLKNALDIAEDISREWGWSLEQLCLPNRRPEYVLPRKQICVRLRQEGLSTPAIGRILQRDHSTVIHHLRSYKNEEGQLMFNPRPRPMRAVVPMSTKTELDPGVVKGQYILNLFDLLSLTLNTEQVREIHEATNILCKDPSCPCYKQGYNAGVAGS